MSEARLASARRFMIQLQHLRFEDVEALDPDVLVTDYSWDGSSGRELTFEDVARLRNRPGRPPRVVLAYMSVGEAEAYRFYWKDVSRRMGLVVNENPKWRGNFRIRYWDPAWQRVLIGGRDSYLWRIQAAGFDGVFLDTIDTAEVMADLGVQDAPLKMAELLGAIAKASRSVDPGFLLVGQNPFVILSLPSVMESLSGISCEAHLFRGEQMVPEARPIISALRLAKAAGLRVFVIEYPRSKKARQRLDAFCAEEGFLCFAGERSLSKARP